MEWLRSIAEARPFRVGPRRIVPFLLDDLRPEFEFEHDVAFREGILEIVPEAGRSLHGLRLVAHHRVGHKSRIPGRG